MSVNKPLNNKNNLNINISAIDNIIKQRYSLKVFADLDQPPVIADDFIATVETMTDVAGYAPFHYPAHHSHRHYVLDSCVPWRFYTLDHHACRQLAACLLEEDPDSKGHERMARMLLAAGSLIQVTWLPDPLGKQESEKQQRLRQHRNEEHLAAASSAVQNLLLMAEARDIQGYWSSGGILATASYFDCCQIPQQEKLLGSIFLFPRPTDDSAQTQAGRLRHKRGHPDSWRRVVSAESIKQQFYPQSVPAARRRK